MKWFSGSIADAVTASKSTNAIFVVYVEGQDELSKIMSSAVDSAVISRELSSNTFVCIKLDKDSESHKQFTEIYKIVPVPSLFFIGQNGVPLEIIPGDNNKEAVHKKIVSAISNIKGEPVSTEEVSVANRSRETTPVPEISGSSNTSINASLSSSSTNVATPSDETKQAEVERVQQLMKKKREENKKLDEEKEKERELARRKMGKEIAQAKKSQQEKEMEQLRKDREKDKKLEAEARQRVLRQIEEDKANRAAKMAANNAQPATSTSNSNVNLAEQRQPTPCQANEGRIQFKLPDGQTRNQTFPATATLRELRTFIDNNISLPFNEYMLATTFPRREYASRDLDSTISELKLLPSSVILVLPVKGETSIMKGPGWTAALSALFWGLVQPVFDFGSYIRSLITGTPRPDTSSSETSPNPSNSSVQQQQQSRSPYYQQNVRAQKNVRRRGNVHTLNDGNDSNDENNTWNGNSTQLM